MLNRIMRDEGLPVRHEGAPRVPRQMGPEFDLLVEHAFGLERREIGHHRGTGAARRLVPTNPRTSGSSSRSKIVVSTSAASGAGAAILFGGLAVAARSGPTSTPAPCPGRLHRP